MHTCRSLLFIASIAAVAACGDPAVVPTPTPDSGLADSGAPADSGVPVDSGVPADSGVAETSVALLTGSAGGAGNLDGPRRDARFSGAAGVARAADGALYIADTSNLIIRKIGPTGEVTTLAGSPGLDGTRDGVGSEARFALPVAIVLAPDGNLIVSDSYSGTLRRVTPAGEVTTFAGRANDFGTVDGLRTDARFRAPEGLAFDSEENLYVVDRGACTIRRITPAGEVSTFTGSDMIAGHADGPREDALLDSPFGVAVDGDGTVAIADSQNNVIRLVSPEGEVSTLAGTPGAGQEVVDGVGAAARFGRPRALVFMDDGALLVADTFNDLLRRVARDGTVTTYAGSFAGSSDGPLATALFSFPSGFAQTEIGLFVADVGSSVIRLIDDGNVETYAGAAIELAQVDGAKEEARFYGPSGMLPREDGSVIIADTYNDSLRVLFEDGRVETLGGRANEPGAIDGPLAEASFAGPRHLEDDGAGGYYVSEWGNNLIRRVSADGIVTTYAGGPVGRGATMVDGPLLDARFTAPSGMALSSTGELYIADAGNHAIRRIDTEGMVTTVAGDGLPDYIDGPGDGARFNAPSELALIDDNTLLVTDTQNHLIRKIVLTQAGALVTTFAGTPPVGPELHPGALDGVGTQASFWSPHGIWIDGDSAIVADMSNSLLRRIRLSDATVTTIAGTRTQYGIAPGPLPGTLFEPTSLMMLPDRRVLVTFLGGVLEIRGL